MTGWRLPWSGVNLSETIRRICLGGLFLGAMIVTVLGLVTWQQFQTFAGAKDGLNSVGSKVVKPIVYDRYGQRLNLTFENRWNLHDQLPLQNIPNLLQTAIIQAEDKRFYQHRGPDWLARLSAGWQNLTALKAVRGASTLSEQVVRMLRPRPRTLWSRWLEGWEAASLERYYSKADILEFYLNQVPYGAQRRGVGQASRYYFGRDVDTLSVKEMLALAVIPRSPGGMSPRQSNPRLARAISSLAQRMRTKGDITVLESAKIPHQPLVVTKAAGFQDVSHFIQYVQHQVQSDRFPTAAAPVIYSSLDLDLQRKIQNILDTRLTIMKNKGVVNGAVLVVNHRQNEVLSWVVGHAGKAGHPFNRINAVLIPRQPGSALKPFVYALALEKGWNAATLIEDRPLQSQVGTGMHEYHNYSRRYYGLIPLREALGNSLNIPALKAVEFVGTAPYLRFLRDTGINSLGAHPNMYGDGIALGNGEVSLFELVQAYSTLARMGKFTPLQVVQGESVYQSERAIFANEVIDESVASLVAHILSDPTAREKEFGRYSILNLPYQTAVKTGTSSDYRDAWSVGFNDRYTVGVWMGNMDYQPMHEVTGSTGPAFVLRSIFHELNKNREVQPLYVSKELQRVRICRETGQLDDEKCETRDELFTEPQRSLLEKESKHEDNTLRTVLSAEVPRIRKPSQGLNMAMDPRIPDEAEYFEFELADVEGVTKVDWYVNDQFISSTAAESLHWQVTRGQFETHAIVWQEGAGYPIKTEPVGYVVH